MAFALHTPRVNNNDDEVRLVDIAVSVGSFVTAGTLVAEIETDKATLSVEAERDGYLLSACGTKGDMVRVGGVLLWFGDTADEKPPVLPSNEITTSNEGNESSKAPTLRAAMLMAKHGIDPTEITAPGQRITVDDVERVVRRRASARLSGVAAPEQASGGATETAERPIAPGKLAALNPQRRGMLRTVVWQRDHAAAGYVEVDYDEAQWTAHATDFQASRKLILSPKLGMIGWRLVQIAKEQPLLNSTLVGSQAYEYENINLGFTVQSGANLFVVVVRDAENMDEPAFVSRLNELQRAAMKKSLKLEETQGATIGLSSMSRWQVTRHIPILLPHTAMMVAHSARDGVGVLGATYDHRVLSGGDVIQALKQLTRPRV